MEGLIDKHVKIVLNDGGQSKVIYGTLKSFSDHDVTVEGEQDSKIMVLGRASIIMMKEA